MNLRLPLVIAFVVPCLGWAAPSPRQVLDRVLEVDPWGMSGAEVSAKVTLKDGSGKATRELAFNGRSRQYAGNLTKSLLRFSAPADLAGVGFLQNQQAEGDDERFLFLPDLKKSKRIAGKLRSQAFMGTDFSYADLDRRDLRQSEVKALADEAVGKFDCYHLDVTPKGSDAEYARIELWVRKDNFMPLRWHMFDAGGNHMKSLTALEVQRVSGKWFLTKSRMVNLKDSRTTELVLEKVSPRNDIPDEEFTVRTLEKS